MKFSVWNKIESIYSHKYSENIYIVYEINKSFVDMIIILHWKNLCFVLLSWTKMLILKSLNIHDMVLDLINAEHFQCLVDLAEMLQSLVLIWILLGLLLIKTLMKVQGKVKSFVYACFSMDQAASFLLIA